MTYWKNTDLAFTREDLRGSGDEPTYSGATSFMRRRFTRDLAGVDVAVLGVPWDLGTSNRPGARFGPRAIRAASTFLAWGRQDGYDFDVFDRLAVVDYGDCGFDFGRPEEAPSTIESQVGSIIEKGSAVLALGGDHFLSFPVLKATAARHGPLSLIHFDAHSDTWKTEPGRRDHGSMFYHAAREGIVMPDRSIQIGLRTPNDDTWGFQQVKAPWVHEHGVAATVDRIRAVVGDRRCYVTFDIDCLDPAFAPGTGTPVIGGLSTHTAQQILRGLTGLNIVGMDITEVAPPYDVAEITALAGATLAVEMLYLFALSPLRLREST
ncbi:MAG: agmatinase [Gammaproteobacteria bacterium]|nr:agmatinase [Gammaproteobacteria bacterium]